MLNDLLVLAHVLAKGVLVIGQVVAFAADPLVVHFVNVSGEPLRAGRLVVAQDAEVGLDVSVEMPLETPIVDTSPGAVGASVKFLLLLLLRRRSGRRRTGRRALLLRRGGRHGSRRPD